MRTETAQIDKLRRNEAFGRILHLRSDDIQTTTNRKVL